MQTAVLSRKYHITMNNSLLDNITFQIPVFIQRNGLYRNVLFIISIGQTLLLHKNITVNTLYTSIL
jgi:hypothetical protein